ncbi:AraC family transcriptional regulator [Rhizobium puerariae]|uniref:AraC family transcriptional regulator n=1 Tax=Rhizobium puerariae TaxID=1585791 RepID=A0ABV6AM17_9HYPH
MQAPSSRGIERIEARFHGNGFSPHRHDTYALGLTLAGVQTFRYRGSGRASLPGNVIVLHPDELHDGAAGTDEGLRYRMLYLQPERLVEAAGGAGDLPFVTDPVVSDAEFRQCLAEALDDLEEIPQDLLLDDLIARLAASLRRHADGRSRSPSTSVARDAMLRCRDYLRDNCDRAVSSGELEAVSGLDRYTTARQFRTFLGTSPHRYLVMRRLDRAKVLLSEGGGLADTAAHAGFADQAHFTRHFKKTFGMTPGRWVALQRSARGLH